jgi:hypothetical protein
MKKKKTHGQIFIIDFGKWDDALLGIDGDFLGMESVMI